MLPISLQDASKENQSESHTLAALKSIQFTLHQEDLPGISAFNVREFWGSPRELEKAASRSHTGTKFIGQIEAGGDWRF